MKWLDRLLAMGILGILVWMVTRSTPKAPETSTPLTQTPRDRRFAEDLAWKLATGEGSRGPTPPPMQEAPKPEEVLAWEDPRVLASEPISAVLEREEAERESWRQATLNQPAPGARVEDAEDVRDRQMAQQLRDLGIE